MRIKNYLLFKENADIITKIENMPVFQPYKPGDRFYNEPHPNSVSINKSNLFKHRSVGDTYDIEDKEERINANDDYRSISYEISNFIKSCGLNMNNTYAILRHFKDNVQEVNIDELIPYQSSLSREDLIKKVNGEDDNEYPPVVYILKDGRKILEGGTHRTAAAILKGEKTIKAIVIPIK